MEMTRRKLTVGEILFFDIQKEMLIRHITRDMMATNIGKRRTAINMNLFHLKRDAIQLKTLQELANSIGKKIKIELIDNDDL